MRSKEISDGDNVMRGGDDGFDVLGLACDEFKANAEGPSLIKWS